jgi:tRNA(Arg) A34 adenosine deaminase TadA
MAEASIRPGLGEVTDVDRALLRRAFRLAEDAVEQGDRPFAAIIVDAEGRVRAEATSVQRRTGDVTAHAEVMAIRASCRDMSREDYAAATIYSSAEPCAMCAGAIYWANIGRLVFGITEGRLRGLRNTSMKNAALRMTCTEVLASGAHPTEVIGAVLEDEAAVAHLTFWKRDAEADLARGRESIL